jgi:HlyD family secretion protein
VAERDDRAAITFHPELLARAERLPDAAELVAAQVQEFQAQRRSLAEEQAQLRERIAQIGRQIEGLGAQHAATEEQAELLSREVSAQEALFQRGLTRQAELLAPQRELARLRGALGQNDAAIAESAAKIAEIEIEILRLASERRRAAIAELRELEFREIELRERRAVLQEEIARLELRAPAFGTVYGSTADTVRGVIRPAEPILYVVPTGVPLVVRARVEPVQVDSVRPGQDAVLRFSAFNSRTTPEVEGEVVAVSADAIADARSGMSFYRVDIRLDAAARTRLEGLELLPGMPVEVFIRTEERSPLSYLVKPIVDYRRFPNQVRHRLCPEPPWERDTATSALRRDAACAA